jgi:hypothetical protein
MSRIKSPKIKDEMMSMIFEIPSVKNDTLMRIVEIIKPEFLMIL